MKAKKGISLIVLVITILVIIVLAGAVILTVVRQNPLDRATEANLRTDKSNIQSAIAIQMGQDLSAANSDSLIVMKSYIKDNSSLALSEGEIDFAKLKSMETAPKLATGLIWYLDANTGRAYIHTTDLVNVPGWAKEGASVKAGYEDLYKIGAAAPSASI